MGASASKRLEAWRRHGGGDFESVLSSGAYALVDARWIVKCARKGGVLKHRQALGKEAFISSASLACPWGSLPVVVLSCPWLSKDHPDPDGTQLRRVAKALESLLTHSPYKRLAVFWDYLSLHQHPDPANGGMRTEAEDALFKQGLDCLGTLYSHRYTTVLRLTTFPDGHKAENQPEGSNVAAYFDRGWCFTESCMASLTKDDKRSLDLGRMRDDTGYDYQALKAVCAQGGCRRPPLLPSQFAAELESKTFANGTEDMPLVTRLYEGAFMEQIGKATMLCYSSLGWGDAEAAQLAEVITSGAAPMLEELHLDGNEIGDEGYKALAAAIRKDGAAPRLSLVSVDSKPAELVAACEDRGILL